ncbi:MAG: hypothetical protein ABF760_04875 [Zymomonas mobilis]|uniref:Uncharacterized protein n=1 Tax=Zymomonas mobilis TaxID=542 RepID=A0A542W177_ZYMMB|nr:hypothetical protein [Zymomonas mobilis]TQL17345.1 hypothetical protein FBY58_0920 [Zymomonas mobilis]
MTELLPVIWSFIKGSWKPILAVSAILLAIGLIHHDGYRRGKRHEQAKYEKALSTSQKQAGLAQQQIDDLTQKMSLIQQSQTDKIRNVQENAQKTASQPVYTAVCGNADASGLLDDARRAANAELASQSNDAAATASSLPSQSR